MWTNAMKMSSDQIRYNSNWFPLFDSKEFTFMTPKSSIANITQMRKFNSKEIERNHLLL